VTAEGRPGGATQEDINHAWLRALDERTRNTENMVRFTLLFAVVAALAGILLSKSPKEGTP
jgi:hypothetical protein